MNDSVLGPVPPARVMAVAVATLSFLELAKSVARTAGAIPCGQVHYSPILRGQATCNKTTRTLGSQFVMWSARLCRITKTRQRKNTHRLQSASTPSCLLAPHHLAPRRAHIFDRSQRHAASASPPACATRSWAAGSRQPAPDTAGSACSPVQSIGFSLEQ